MDNRKIILFPKLTSFCKSSLSKHLIYWIFLVGVNNLYGNLQKNVCSSKFSQCFKSIFIGLFDESIVRNKIVQTRKINLLSIETFTSLLGNATAAGSRTWSRVGPGSPVSCLRILIVQYVGSRNVTFTLLSLPVCVPYVMLEHKKITNKLIVPLLYFCSGRSCKKFVTFFSHFLIKITDQSL